MAMRPLVLASLFTSLGLAAGCGSDGDADGDADGTESATDSSTGTAGTVTNASATMSSSATSATTASTSNTTNTTNTTSPGSETADTSDSADETDESGPLPSDCDFTETFDLPDGSPWPAYWTPVGGIETADIQGGRGRLVPTPGKYALARLITPVDCADIEVTYSFEFTDPTTQGVGMYVRQNGGYLALTDPVGEGYVSFVQGFMSPPGIGMWREREGIEELIDGNEAATVLPGVLYRARMRVTQIDAESTNLQGKFWPDGSPEPEAFQVERIDSTPSIQGVGGNLAADAYNSPAGPSGAMFFDDIVATAAP